MKQRINFIDHIHNKTTSTEVEIRDLMHLDAQIRFKANTFKPKKGKGSFKRRPKYPRDDES